jgi:hypothetical protein
VFVTLEEDDRIVLTHVVPKDDRIVHIDKGQMTVFATDADGENGYVLYRGTEKPTGSPVAWVLMWKGDWDNAIKFYIEYVSNLDEEITAALHPKTRVE